MKMKTRYYFTADMLRANGACFLEIENFEKTFGVSRDDERVFLTESNVRRAIEANIPLRWVLTVRDDCGNDYSFLCDLYWQGGAPTRAEVKRAYRILYNRAQRNARARGRKPGEIRVGDSVRVVAAEMTFNDYANGDTAKVKRIESNGIAVEWDRPKSDSACEFLYFREVERIDGAP